MRVLDDPEQVAEQYRDSRNFDARVRIYECFANNPVPWLERAYAHLGVHEGERILDVGCGTGNIWRDNASRLPPRLDLTLADQSQGMIDEAAARLGAAGIPARFEVADIQRLPYDNDAFDLVVANHMLYHVADRPAALSELRRVVRPGGRCIVSTNDWPHLIELRELIDRFGIPTAMRRVGREPGFFDAEQAAEELCDRFDSVTATRFHDSLDVTDADVLLAYVESMVHAGEGRSESMEQLRQHAQQQIDRLGSMHITTSLAAFEARKDGA